MLKSIKYIAPYILNSIYNNLTIHYHTNLIHNKIKIHFCEYTYHILKIWMIQFDGLQDKIKLLNKK